MRPRLKRPRRRQEAAGQPVGTPDQDVGGDAASDPGPRGHTIGIRRVVVLTAVAATSFGLATVSFAGPSDRDCSVTMRGDSRYALKLEGPYRDEHNHPAYRLVVTKRGQPLDPERVCISSFPNGAVVVVDDSRRAHIHIEREPPEESGTGEPAGR